MPLTRPERFSAFPASSIAPRPRVRTCLGPRVLARQFRRSRAAFWPTHNAMPQLQNTTQTDSIPLRLSHSRLPKSKTQFNSHRSDRVRRKR